MSFYTVVKAAAGLVFRLIYRIEVHGKENIPTDGKLVLCSNHIHNFDPIILSIVFPRQIFWMAKKQIFENKILSYLFKNLGAFPVDREESDLSAIKNSLKVLKKEGVLGIFPEGTRVKEFNLKNAKPGISLISIKAHSMVLPVYIEGDYRIFSKIKVYFGKPIDFSKYYNGKLSTDEYRLLSQEILQSIYSNKYKEEGKIGDNHS
ncbi:1-acyl-sn-glycerol-3-phosphate acyltransferase [Tissierella pigra]|uniref:lysophospholipid acyltransferase family protein n=1 Tax=Tissierella pigra TaxID=2607614 RepID=UPI001C10D6FF|nr:lysophospholipid acyltransferase family protein [Tissierella pigra]MBU5426621.1 1-acyl-sn-glycerol-3-phosphate acyltransferase [Tissierella pigra]